MSESIEVFTDGSCMKKKYGNYCGYGIYFPNGEIPNISRKFTHSPLTNQRAELYAIYVALILIKKVGQFDNVVIYSDSEYSIKCLTVWIHTWNANKWKTAKNDPVKNQDIIKPLYDILRKFKHIKFVHVRSHTGNTDVLSVGNEMADKLATQGSMKNK